MASSGDALLRQGDTRLDAGDFEGAVRQWRAAGAAGLETASTARMKALLRRYASSGPADRTVPRPALGPLKLLVTASTFGTLSFFASNHGPGESDVPLVWLGWILYGVATAAVLAFAVRSGRLDGRTAATAAIDSLPYDELGHRAEALARRLNARRPSTTAANAIANG